MNASENMKARLVDYIEAFNAADAARVVALFADNASVEDPVGTPLKDGRSEIETFYTYATSVGARLELVRLHEELPNAGSPPVTAHELTQLPVPDALRFRLTFFAR